MIKAIVRGYLVVSTLVIEFFLITKHKINTVLDRLALKLRPGLRASIENYKDWISQLHDQCTRAQRQNDVFRRQYDDYIQLATARIRSLTERLDAASAKAQKSKRKKPTKNAKRKKV